jgi:hypothetical protein
VSRSFDEEAVMGDKSPHKVATKKDGKTLKEKRAAKKAKHSVAATPLLPPRPHTSQHS